LKPLLKREEGECTHSSSGFSKQKEGKRGKKRNPWREEKGRGKVGGDDRSLRPWGATSPPPTGGERKEGDGRKERKMELQRKGFKRKKPVLLVLTLNRTGSQKEGKVLSIASQVGERTRGGFEGGEGGGSNSIFGTTGMYEFKIHLPRGKGKGKI